MYLSAYNFIYIICTYLQECALTAIVDKECGSFTLTKFLSTYRATVIINN